MSRASFYHYDENAVVRPDRDMDLRDAIQRIALEWPSYGRPRIMAALRRDGWVVNPNGFTDCFVFGQSLTTWTARAAAVLYACGLLLVVRGRWNSARVVWTAGLSAYLVHVWCAFEYSYHWSHAFAYAETARQTAELYGVRWGGGLYLNYLFTAVWLADGVAAWLKPDWWRKRSNWFGLAVNVFLGFMFVNATLVVWVLRGLRRR